MDDGVRFNIFMGWLELNPHSTIWKKTNFVPITSEDNFHYGLSRQFSIGKTNCLEF